MAIERIIEIDPGSEVASLLEEAADAPVLLNNAGKLFRLNRVQQVTDIWAGYDPRAVREAIRAGAGSWKDLDAEVLKAAVYRAREEGTRPDAES